MKQAGAEILGTGSYLPESVLDNEFFIRNGPYKIYQGQDKKGEIIWKKNEKGEIKYIELTEEKILKQTGIKTRRIAAVGESVVDIAEKALLNALEDASILAQDLAGIICATVSHNAFPSVASFLQDRINAKNVTYILDVGAACSGFSYALDLADKLIKYNNYGPIAVIGAETLTKMIDYTEINCNLFGDGGGCCIVAPGQTGIVASAFLSDALDGRTYWLFRDKYGYVRMPKGPSIMKLAVRRMIEAADIVKEKAIYELSINKEKLDGLIKLIVPHQANLNIIKLVEKRLNGITVYKEGIRKYGNISAATCPIGIDEIRRGKARDSEGNLITLNKGDMYILTAFGGGLLTGANAIIN